MAECEICGKEIVNPFKCNYCGGSFCNKHRLPPNHECPNIGAWGDRSGPTISSHEKKKSWIAKKKDAVSQNISLPFISQGSEENRGESFESNYSEERLEGEVKFYNQRKNYGFIIPDDGGEDVFFRGSDVRKGWLKTEIL